MKPLAVFLFVLAIMIWVASIWVGTEANVSRHAAMIERSNYGLLEAARLDQSASTMRVAAAVTFLVSLILLAVVFDRDRKLRGSKKCPKCAEFIKRDAVKCRYCGSDLIPEFS